MRLSKSVSRMLAAAAVVFGLCGGAWADGRIVVALGAQPPSLDPHVTTANLTNSISRHIYETLVTQDAKLQIQPALAESWTVSEDGRHYRFVLRNDVKFHNGQKLTAADAVASLARWQNYSLPGRNVFQGAKWNAEGDDVVTLELPSPRFNALETLASGINQSAAIMPASIIAAAGEKPVSDVVGTGPFKLKEWQADRLMELDRYEGYAPVEGEQSGMAGDRTPTFDTLVLEFVSDESTRLLGLKTGEYDIIPDLPYENITEVKEDDSLRLGSYPYTLLNLYFNKAKPGIFTDKRAREAVDIGLERVSVLTAAAVEPQFFRLNNHLMMLGQDDWTTEVGKTEYNPADTERAKALLAEAGYDGHELVLITSRDYSDMYNSAIVLQQQLIQLGLNVKVENYDWPTFTKVRVDKEAWDFMVLSNVMKLDPSQLVTINKNFPGWPDDAALEAILEKFRAAGTMKEAQELYRQLEAWNQSFIPAAKIGDIDNVFATSARIESMQVQGGPVYWTVKLAD